MVNDNEESNNTETILLFRYKEKKENYINSLKQFCLKIEETVVAHLSYLFH